MNRYRLRANYDIENIDSRKENGTMIVDVPMLSNGKLNYGLRHIKQKLYEEEVYPSEIGFDIMSFATMVYMADTRIERAVHGQDSWTREIELEIPVSNIELWDAQIPTIERMLKFLTGDFWKIILSSRTWKFNNPQEVKEKYTVLKSAPYFLEILDKRVNKGTGVKSLADVLGIKPEEIMAIGDQENDIAMIEYAGIGVAMDNAIPSVKEVANFVTKSNLEDGVAFAIEKYVLN